MSFDNFNDRMYTRSSKENLHKHLENTYEIQIKQLTELDLGVFRADLYDGPSWIVRQFPRTRSIESVKGDAEILNFLNQHNFPAEKCAHSDAVSILEEKGVIVTNFVHGTRIKGSERAYYFLGILLGQLHSLPLDSNFILREGGAWHHLADEGGPREEIDAAISLLINSEHDIPGKHHPLFKTLCSELMQIDDLHDMPKSLIHPDFVPSNMVKLDVGNWTVIDWAGAGLGPRIWSLGFLLWAAGNKSLQCIDAVIYGYRKYIKIDMDELEHLFNAVVARPIIFNSWKFCMGKSRLSDVMQELPEIHQIAKTISRHAMEAFK